jgi:signal transduction histidine kinase
MQPLINFFGANGLIPHGYCLTWSPGLLWLHVLSDALIVIAYYSIPLTLAYFVRKRKDLPYPWLFAMFGLFIVACGTTHLLSVITVWIPLYWLDGIIKAVTAIISVVAAVMVVWVVPRALMLRSPAQLEIEVQERKQAQAALQERTNQLLEAQGELVRREKLALLGQVAGSVGHELRNPLGVMNNAVYFLQTVLVDADETTKEYLCIIKEEIGDAERIVSDLLDAVRTKPPHPEIVELAELMQQTLRKCDVPPCVTVRPDI